MPFGKIESFNSETQNWDAYVRRVEQFITLNDIKAELKVATLVTLVGAECYDLMFDLCSLNSPETKTFSELVKLVKDHLEPDRSEIAERHIFRQRKQQQGESIRSYLQGLKHLAKTCNFGSTLEVNLRDQFVSGLHSEEMRSRLFAEKNIDYKRAVELALAVEAAVRPAGPPPAAAESEAYSYLNFAQEDFPLSFKEIKTETAKDSLLSKIYGYVMFGWPSHNDKDSEKSYYNRRENLHVDQGCLVWGYRVVVLQSLRETIHSGHPGTVKMKQIARNYVWWESLEADIERTVERCAACRGERATPPPAPLHSWSWPHDRGRD